MRAHQRFTPNCSNATVFYTKCLLHRKKRLLPKLSPKSIPPQDFCAKTHRIANRDPGYYADHLNPGSFSSHPQQLSSAAILSRFFNAAILSSYLQQSSCYCWVGGHLATFGVGGHLATVRISGHLATAGGCGHLATVVVGGHLAKFGLWVSYLISFCCCQGWWSAIPHHKNPFRLGVFEEKKNESCFLSSNFSVACKTSSSSLRHRSSTGPRAPEPHRLSSFMT